MVIINWLKKISDFIPFQWLPLSLPVLILTVQYLTEFIYYGQFIHATGVYPLRLLIFSMAIISLRLA